MNMLWVVPIISWKKSRVECPYQKGAVADLRYRQIFFKLVLKRILELNHGPRAHKYFDLLPSRIDPMSQDTVYV